MEPNATTGKTPVGLTAILPLGKKDGRNKWVVNGWQKKLNDMGDEKFILKSVDGRSSDEMGNNKLLETLAEKEMENVGNFASCTLTSATYKSPFVIEFDYTSERRNFKTPYTKINVYLQGTAPKA